jgi:hypothetical protein
MKKIYFILYALLASSCLTQVPIDLPEASNQVVVNSLLCTSDSATAYISLTYPAYGDEKVNSPENTQVFITDALSKVYPLELTSNIHSKSSFYKGTFVPRAGETYRMTVVTGKGDTLWAYSTMPQVVPIDSFYLKKGIPEYEGDNPIVLKIRFTDPAEQTNYYLVGFTIYGSMYEYQYDQDSDLPVITRGFNYEGWAFRNKISSTMNTDEPLIGKVQYNDKRILCFSDKDINGASYTLSIGIRDLSIEDYHQQVLFVPKLYSITAETYWYFKSINYTSDNEESYIAEPINTYTNFKNGLGILGGMALATDSLMVRPEDLQDDYDPNE